jgi:hypothetical protein
MKKVTLSVVTIALLSSGAYAADNLADAFKEGKTSGQIRSFYIDRTYEGSLENNRNSLAVGGNLGFETGSVNGLSAGVRFYTTNNIDLHSGPRSSANYDPSLFGDGFTSYSMVGEAFFNFKGENTNVKIGRQKLNTPLAGADDARMLPNLFEAAVLSNTSLDNTKLIAAHVTRESVGTFGNVYGPGQLSIQSGYGLGFKSGTNGRFADMGRIALGDAGADTIGVTAAAAIYKGIPGLTLQAWDYYAHDILNAIYLQGDYGWNCALSDSVKMKASGQLIHQSDVGDKLAGKVDSKYAAAKLTASTGGLTGYVAYSRTGSSTGTQANGGIITPWGGIPAFTQGMVTRHMFFAGTDTTKVAASYNFKEAGVKATAYHSAFDIGAKNTYKAGQAWEAKESGFDIQYKPAGIKNLNLRLRANYPTDFAPGLDWSEYRVIANYNF